MSTKGPETRKRPRPAAGPQSEAVEELETAAIAFAEVGEWKKAAAILASVPKRGLCASVTAYGSVISACRRARQYDLAAALFQQMYKLCMPEDLLEAFASPGPQSLEYTQTERIFHLVLTMKQNGVAPNEETYRAVMSLCVKDRLWEVGLLLMQYTRDQGIEPGKFLYDELCKLLQETGMEEVADMVYEQALEGGVLNPWTGVAGLIDLHLFTLSTAKCAVRTCLFDMARRPKSRHWHDVGQDFKIITGMGKHSAEGVAVLRPAILVLLGDLKLPAALQAHNPGLIQVQALALTEWLQTSAAPQREG